LSTGSENTQKSCLQEVLFGTEKADLI